MTDATTPDPQLNRAGRRAQARTGRTRKAGAVMATIPAAFGTTALLLGATAVPAGAADLVVTNLDPSGAGSLQDVAEAANDGDVITFQAGLTGTIFLDDVILIDTSVTIQGPGAGVITVSGDTGNNGSGDVQLFDINGPGSSTSIDVVISGLTLTDGVGNFGAAVVFDDANLTIRDAVLTGNDAGAGGGGAIATEDQDQDLVIENTTITGNAAGDNGGGVYFYSPDGGTFTMINSTVSDNTAEGDGGGLWIKGESGGNLLGAVSITGSTITGNTAGGDGGGAFVHYVSSVTITDTTITDTTISGNTAGGEGGGAFINYVDGPVSITGTTISGNTAGGDGGGGLMVYYVTGDTAITGSTISENSSAGYGGGIYFGGMQGTTTISSSTIAGNTAGEGGGGIEFYNSGGLVIRNSTVSGNTAAGWGGGLYLSDDSFGPVQISNSTISGNTAAEDGGGIWFATYYGLTLVQTTITGNVASTVGGVFIYDGSVHEDAAAASDKGAEKDAQRAERLAEKNAERAEKGAEPVEPQVRERSTVRATAFEAVMSSGTIIAGNSGADVGTDGALEATGSLFGSISGTTLVDQGGNLFGVDPLLGPLQDNGGPTRTHALLDGSPAINAGPDPVADFPGNEDDQRGPGYPRVIGGRVDIGAFEVQPTNLEPTFTG